MVQESLSGFEKKGSWDEVVEHGEIISETLDEHDVDGEKYEEWESWRPKRNDDLDDEIAERTVEKASVDPEGDSGLKKKGKELFEELERTIYKKIVNKTNPYYFENELICANIDEKGRINGMIEDTEGGPTYRFEVKVHSRYLREKLRKALD